MITRRAAIQSLRLLGVSALLGSANRVFAMTKERSVWFMPDEGDPHQRTWMAFGVSKKIWGSKLLWGQKKVAGTIVLTAVSINHQARHYRYFKRLMYEPVYGTVTSVGTIV